MGVLVVGASVAGLAAADALRSAGYDASITVVDADPAVPYDKPPLSKQALAQGWNPERGRLRSVGHYDAQRIELVLGRTVTGVDTGARTAILDDGTARKWDHLVLAPGVRARTLPTASTLRGVHAIRTAADSDAVRAAFADNPRVVIVGGGFIGAEAAAMAVRAGCDVTVVEQLEKPFLTIFGPEVAEALARRHRDHGVRLVGGTGVADIVGDDWAEQVVLTDGRVLPADLVLLGIGAVPAVDWLAASGVTIADGITCDEFGRTSVEHVWAAGDAAAWWDPSASRHRRVEHWTTAKEHGAAVGHNIARPEDPARTVRTVPYFWSDQYGTRLQFLGSSAGHDAVTLVHGGWDTEDFVVLYSREGRIIGGLGLGAARELMRFRAAVASGEQLREAIRAVGGVDAVPAAGSVS